MDDDGTIDQTNNIEIYFQHYVSAEQISINRVDAAIMEWRRVITIGRRTQGHVDKG